MNTATEAHNDAEFFEAQMSGLERRLGMLRNHGRFSNLGTRNKIAVTKELTRAFNKQAERRAEVKGGRDSVVSRGPVTEPEPVTRYFARQSESCFDFSQRRRPSGQDEEEDSPCDHLQFRDTAVVVASAAATALKVAPSGAFGLSAAVAAQACATAELKARLCAPQRACPTMERTNYLSGMWDRGRSVSPRTQASQAPGCARSVSPRIYRPEDLRDTSLWGVGSPPRSPICSPVPACPSQWKARLPLTTLSQQSRSLTPPRQRLLESSEEKCVSPTPRLSPSERRFVMKSRFSPLTGSAGADHLMMSYAGGVSRSPLLSARNCADISPRETQQSCTRNWAEPSPRGTMQNGQLPFEAKQDQLDLASRVRNQESHSSPAVDVLQRRHQLISAWSDVEKLKAQLGAAREEFRRVEQEQKHDRAFDRGIGEINRQADRSMRIADRLAAVHSKHGAQSLVHAPHSALDCAANVAADAIRRTETIVEDDRTTPGLTRRAAAHWEVNLQASKLVEVGSAKLDSRVASSMRHADISVLGSRGLSTF